jgi:hypothetical protein
MDVPEFPHEEAITWKSLLSHTSCGDYFRKEKIESNSISFSYDIYPSKMIRFNLPNLFFLLQPEAIFSHSMRNYWLFFLCIFFIFMDRIAAL